MYSRYCAVREETLLSREILGKRSGFLDWDTQPSMFKTYPLFLPRIPLERIPQLQWLYHTRFVSDTQFIADKAYQRLNVPSAGNLHPIEIYVQLRNIPDLPSGLYHVSPQERDLILIREIGKEGIESSVGLKNRFNGAIVILSLAPFRSYWKYALRSWRYLYLDLGHQIATLDASVRHFEHSLSCMSPTKELSVHLGFGEDEYVAAVYGIGEIAQREAYPIAKPLMQVKPTDYSEPMTPLMSKLAEGFCYSQIPVSSPIHNFQHINAIRRSARSFNPLVECDDTIKKFMQIPYALSLTPLFVVLRAHSMHCGIYKNNTLVREGKFANEMVRLLLDQRFIGNAAMIVLMYADDFDERSHIEAGVFAQSIYFHSHALGLGCSGIGAFFDDEAHAYESKNLIYAVAIGGQ